MSSVRASKRHASLTRIQVLLATLLLAAASLAIRNSVAAFAQPSAGTLQLSIVDADTEQPIPARVGTSSAIHFPENYVIYRLFWEEAQRQGALSGYAHYGSDLLARHRDRRKARADQA